MTTKKVRIKENEHYSDLVSEIGTILEDGRNRVAISINNILTETYWNIGKQIVVFEQKGEVHAEYGSELLVRLSKDLKSKYGKGFSRSNIYNMRRLYLKYPKIQALPGKLSWTHIVELLEIDDDTERGFYEKQCVLERWSSRELSRQIDSSLFQRIALSKDKKGVIELSKKGQIPKESSDIIKNPYVLEFLNIPEQEKYTERKLESEIIENLQSFLLELGKGFTFVGRQFRMNIGKEHYYVDLVFYHRLLKCFVLIDLKTGTVDHKDIGQMNMYLNYFKKEENQKDENPPIGLLLVAKKNDIVVEYALGGLSNQLFVSKYQLYLPNKEMLENKLRNLLHD